MAGLVEELISGVIKSAVREILKKSHKTTTTRRTRRKAGTTTKSSARTRRTSSLSKRIRKPAKKQISRRKTNASRAKTRQL